MKSLLAPAALAAIGLAAVPAFAAPNPVVTPTVTTPKPATAADQQPFLAKAAQGDMAEIEMGKLVQSKAVPANYKAYGKTLVTDHGAHRTKVVALAKAEGVAVPAAVSPEQKAEYDHLASLNGDAFETAFKQHMVAAHRKNIETYKAQLSNPDARIAALAKQTLPTLDKHLAAAQAL